MFRGPPFNSEQNRGMGLCARYVSGHCLDSIFPRTWAMVSQQRRQQYRVLGTRPAASVCRSRRYSLLIDVFASAPESGRADRARAWYRYLVSALVAVLPVGTRPFAHLRQPPVARFDASLASASAIRRRHPRRHLLAAAASRCSCSCSARRPVGGGPVVSRDDGDRRRPTTTTSDDDDVRRRRQRPTATTTSDGDDNVRRRRSHDQTTPCLDRPPARAWH